jgi:hypothetical protein
MPGNLTRLEGQIPAPIGGQPLSDPPRFFRWIAKYVSCLTRGSFGSIAPNESIHGVMHARRRNTQKGL